LLVDFTNLRKNREAAVEIGQFGSPWEDASMRFLFLKNVLSLSFFFLGISRLIACSITFEQIKLRILLGKVLRCQEIGKY
jgi:hypothetical protein